MQLIRTWAPTSLATMDQPTRKQSHFAEDIQPGADEDDLACAMMEDDSGYNASSVEHPLFYYDDGNLIILVRYLSVI